MRQLQSLTDICIGLMINIGWIKWEVDSKSIYCNLINLYKEFL